MKMDFMAKVKEEVAHELMRAEWPKNGLFVGIRSIEDAVRIKITLSEYKFNKIQKPPRTKVEYVKVDESIFDLSDDFEKGVLYFIATTNGEYHKIDAIKVLGLNFDKGNIYRRIETQITEREEFIERAIAIDELSIGMSFEGFIGKLYDAGCRFVEE